MGEGGSVASPVASGVPTASDGELEACTLCSGVLLAVAVGSLFSVGAVAVADGEAVTVGALSIVGVVTEGEGAGDGTSSLGVADG